MSSKLDLSSALEFDLTLYPKLRGIRLALCFLDDHWSRVINMHVRRRSPSGRDSFTTTLLVKEYSIGVQCTIGGLDQRFVLGPQIGNSPSPD